jgi:hypothetical protein
MSTYSLELFNTMTFNGFNYVIPSETMNIISQIASEVGAPNYVKTPVFQKREHSNILPITNTNSTNSNTNITCYKKKKNSRLESTNEAEWEMMRTFQTTKIDQKTGIGASIDTLRAHLNKLTDKNYNEYKNKIIELIEELKNDNTPLEEMSQVSYTLFEIASTNRFYSKIYANLYTDIITNYNFMSETFENSINKFSELFDVIEYVDPTVNYDKFCKINIDNEKRKALSAFFVNLMNTKVISIDRILLITRKLVSNIYTFISMEDKKNEVDELAENVALLYNKDIFENDDGELNYEQINGLTISEIIEKIANSNVKEYPSLTKKTIFKFMDLVDI